jgi:NCK-associated protein 1
MGFGWIQIGNIQAYRQEINKTLHLYYHTFVDLLDFKDRVSELFTIMHGCQVELDIVSGGVNIYSFSCYI